MARAQIYLPDHQKRSWQDFKEICKREGKSPSKKVLAWIQRYVDAHKHGNPQTTLPNWTRERRERQPKPARPVVGGVVYYTAKGKRVQADMID